MEEQLNYWGLIEKILVRHTTKYSKNLLFKEPIKFLFGSKNADIDEVLEKNCHLFKKQSFIWAKGDNMDDDEAHDDLDENFKCKFTVS